MKEGIIVIAALGVGIYIGRLQLERKVLLELSKINHERRQSKERKKVSYYAYFE